MRQKVDVHNIDALNPVHYVEVDLYTKINHLRDGKSDDLEIQKEIAKNVGNLIHAHFISDLIYFAKEGNDFNIDKRYYIANRNIDDDLFDKMVGDLLDRIKRATVPFMKALYRFPYMDFAVTQEYSWAYDCEVVNVQARLHKED
jgi:hypothetical protein